MSCEVHAENFIYPSPSENLSSIPNSVNMQLPDVLHRYTCLDALYDLLDRNEIKFSNWKTWEDKNDVELLNIYRSHFNKALFVYCMTSASETIHHWNAYAKNENGCRIKFNISELAKHFLKQGVHCQNVTYLKIDELKNRDIKIEDYPFIKRFPYRIEQEFRLVKVASIEKRVFKLEVDYSVIEQISLSPFACPRKNEELKQNLIRNYPFLKRKFSNSRIIKNNQWINHFKQAI